MEEAVPAVHTLLKSFPTTDPVGEVLLCYVRQLEKDLAKSQDIVLFIFAVRCFFCWHRSGELAADKKELDRVKQVWLDQNDSAYSRWLSSKEDQADLLKWEKWTFQAKISLLAEFAAATAAPAAH